MALPPSGWVSAAFIEHEVLPLPEPVRMIYQDTFRFGQVSGLRVLVAGHPPVFNRSGHRFIDIEIQFAHVHDVFLLDTIF